MVMMKKMMLMKVMLLLFESKHCVASARPRDFDCKISKRVSIEFGSDGIVVAFVVVTLVAFVFSDVFLTVRVVVPASTGKRVCLFTCERVRSVVCWSACISGAPGAPCTRAWRAVAFRSRN